MSEQRQYIDFKLYLTKAPGGEGGYQVSLLPTDKVGETIIPVSPKGTIEALDDYLPYLADKSITLRDLVKLGKALADLLLPEGDIRDLFKEAHKQAGNRGGVRLRLIIADHELKQIPWEFVYLNLIDDQDSMRGFLALEPRISIVRHEPLPLPHPTAVEGSADTNELRMMVAAASPDDPDLPELQVGKEVELLKKALADFQVDGLRIKAEPILENATPTEVKQALQGAGSAQIFHFAGHGESKLDDDPFAQGSQKKQIGYLYFIKDKDKMDAAEVKADDLAKLLQQADVWLVTLGACYSADRTSGDPYSPDSARRNPWDGVAGSLLARGIPAVVAMQYEVLDDEAIKFTKAFYTALSSGLSLDEAMSFGRLAMYEDSGDDLDQTVPLEWGIPVLYSRLPDGILVRRLAERESETADKIRVSVEQVIDLIDEGSEVIGIDTTELIPGDVKQEVKTVKKGSKLTGYVQRSDN